MSLKLGFCEHDAALYSVKKWHYSKALPSGKLVSIGVWEDEKFIGCVIFSRGANNHLLQPYGLEQIEGCELTRIALDKHKAPVTQIASIAIKLLRKSNPGLKLIVSFADSRQGHLGKIYQAGNWVFTGSVKSTPDFFVDGRWQHQRNMHSKFGTIKGLRFETRDGGYRHRYLYPLTEEMRVLCDKIKKPLSDMRV